ncbi:MAG: lectin like domain-containing protein [Acutalibacteraceae bacterium]
MRRFNKIFAFFFAYVVLFSSVNTDNVFAVSDELNANSVNDEFSEYYSSVDLGYVIPAESQGESNSCWAFSALGVLSAYAVKNGLHSYENADFSEAHLTWYTGNSRSFDENETVYGDGISSDSAYDDTVDFFMPTFTLAKGSGIAFEKEYPFYSSNSLMGHYEETERYNHSAGWLSKSVLLNNTDDIKAAVVQNGAVQIGIYYSPDKLNDTTKLEVENDEFVLTGNCSYYNNTSEGYGHAVIIVGWDDNYPKENFKEACRPKRNGAWLCKNSWGTSWGENGLFWISYENAELVNPMTLECVSADTYDNVYQYDGFGFNRCITAKQFKTSSVANVFTSNQTEVIEAVGFYTYQQALFPDGETAIDIEISIYKDLIEEYTNPTQGTLAVKYNTSVDYSGYHTFKFPNPVPLIEGEVYSVVITMSSNENTPVILLEGNETEELKYHANAGESFISLSGKTTDFFDSAKKYGGNVCVKTFTKNYDGASFLGVDIQPDDCVLHVNDIQGFEVQVKPLGAKADLIWASSDESIATVSSDGVVECVGTGDAVITVLILGTDCSAECKIKVLPEFLTIEWVVDNEITVSQYKYGDAITLPKTPVKKGYVFKEWSAEVPNVMPAHNLKFTAFFEPDFYLSIRKPSTDTISYADTLLLHADIDGTLPDGSYIKWTSSNNNFSCSVSGDGKICAISPVSSGNTTFTATLFDAEGKVLDNDEQIIISKASFFDRVIAFFKKIFGLTKTIPEVFKNIF